MLAPFGQASFVVTGMASSCLQEKLFTKPLTIMVAILMAHIALIAKQIRFISPGTQPCNVNSSEKSSTEKNITGSLLYFFYSGNCAATENVEYDSSFLWGLGHQALMLNVIHRVIQRPWRL